MEKKKRIIAKTYKKYIIFRVKSLKNNKYIFTPFIESEKKKEKKKKTETESIPPKKCID